MDETPYRFKSRITGSDVEVHYVWDDDEDSVIGWWVKCHTHGTERGPELVRSRAVVSARTGTFCAQCVAAAVESVLDAALGDPPPPDTRGSAQLVHDRRKLWHMRLRVADVLLEQRFTSFTDVGRYCRDHNLRIDRTETWNKTDA